MGPKPDAGGAKIVYIRQMGGDVAPSAVLAPKLGPLGMSPKKVGDDIAKATAKWKGLKVQVKLTVENRVATVEVVPTATSLLIAELKEPIRDRKKKDQKNIKHNGNLTLDQVYGVARQMREKSQAKEFQGTVLEMLGTCYAIGCTVENRAPKDIQTDIYNGKIDVPAS
eukprot:GHVN01033910.1.p1 GENE.GHVN01033910.1~~GHVN01033910.1.p1  ORF type:complete len:168 (+),score=30.43 GHVN01033910.1:55-558(+)